MVMHSYGGVVGSEANLKAMSQIKRQEKGLLGGVIQLSIISAFLLDMGQSMLGALIVSPNDRIEVSAPVLPMPVLLTYVHHLLFQQSDDRYTIMNCSFILYNDLPLSEAISWESRLIPHSYKVQRTKLTRAS